jgi:uncharacterized phage protein gp47/JayE
MPAPFGVTPTGFNKKTMDDITPEMQAAEAGLAPPVLNFAPSSVISQINNILSAKIAEMWDVAEAVYRQFYPDSAEGDALDNVASVNGAVRLAATKSSVTVHVTGVNGTVIPAGSIVKTTTDGTQFVSVAPATIALGVANIVFNGITVGPLVAPAGTLTIIVTPVGGWNTANNPLDAMLGTNEEKDPHFRDRRLDLLATPGTGTGPSILSAVRLVTGVTEALFFENTTLTPDANGVPGKAFETVVEGGADGDIAAAIASKKPGGIQAYGTTVVAVADSQGNNHQIGFSRPVEIDIYVTITVAVKVSDFGGGNQAQGIIDLQEAIVTAGGLLGIGDEVVALRIEAAALAQPGVFDVTSFKIDTVFPAVGTVNIPITNHQQSKFDTSRVAVTVTNA